MILQRPSSGQTISKSASCRPLIRPIATGVLVAYLLLAATITNGQQVTSSRQTASSGTKQATRTNSNQSPLLGNGDQLAAPFYSIKDGKTSARRIQQQQSLSSGSLNDNGSGNANSNQQRETGDWSSQPSTTTSTISTIASQTNNDNNRDEFPVNPSQSTSSNDNAFNEDNVKRLVNDRRQQQQQVAFNAGGDSSDQQSTMAATSGDQTNGIANENNITQQRMLISSFNQLVGADGSLGDFLPSTTTTTTTAMPRFDGASSDSGLNFDQQQSIGRSPNSFTTTTTMSSLSDGTLKQANAGEFKQAGRAANQLILQPLMTEQEQQPVMQFTTATGAPLSTPPSSLSMSLDGMIVNSRPRSSSSASGEPVSFERFAGNSGKKKQQQTGGNKLAFSANAQSPARIGELASAAGGANQRSSLDKTPTKVSRRVPFNGVPFSSPASKGQRNRPNQQQPSGLFNGAQQATSTGLSNGIFGPQANDLMAGLQQFDQTMMMAAGKRPISETSTTLNNAINSNDAFRQVVPVSSKPLIEQLNMANFVQQEQQMDTNLQGFDEDQQQQQQQQQRPNRLNNLQTQQVGSINGDSSIDNNTLELMKNLMNSPTLRGQVDIRGSNSTGSSPNDMVMSVMSSVDGKERRLVMIARNTLEGLQRFAAAQNQQQTVGGNSVGASKNQDFSGQQKSTWRPAQQQAVNFNRASMDSNQVNQGSTSNWWPSGATWAPSLAGQQNNAPTTVTPFRDSSQSEQQQQQQEVQLQTTTAAPLNVFSNSAAITTISPLISTSSILATQSPDFGQTKIDSQTDLSRKNDLQSMSNNSTTISSMRASDGADDSFREVPVSSLVENLAGVTTEGVIPTQQQQQQQQEMRPQISGGSGKQQNGVKSKTNNKSTVSSSTRSSGKQLTDSISSGPLSKSQKSSSKQQLSIGGGSQQRNKNSSASETKSPKSGKKKNNGSSSGGRQTNSASNGVKQAQKSDKTSGSKSTTGRKTTLSSGNQSGSQNSNRQQANSQQQQSIAPLRVTNGQQQPAAMRAAFEQQQQSNGGESSGKRPSGSIGREEQTTSQSSSAGAIGSGSKSVNDQLSTTEQQQQTTTTTSSSVPNNKRPQPSSQKPNSLRPASDDKRQEQWSSQSPVTQMPATGTRLSVAGDNNRSRDSEFGRAGSSSSSSLSSPSSMATSDGGSAQKEDGPQSETARLEDLRAAIPGEPQVDYPIYSAPPKTSFDCMSQSCPGGYYADLETQCQVFHICQNDGRFDTFLCPNGTIFSQQHFVCVWWWQVDCQQSINFYKLNDGIYCNSMISTSTGGGLLLNSNSAELVARSNGTIAQMANGSASKFDDSINELNESNESAGSMSGGVSSPSSNDIRTPIMSTDGATGGPSSTSSSSSSLGGLDERTSNIKTQSGAQPAAAGVANDDTSMKQQIGQTQADDAELSQQHIERLVKKA